MPRGIVALVDRAGLLTRRAPDRQNDLQNDDDVDRGDEPENGDDVDHSRFLLRRGYVSGGRRMDPAAPLTPPPAHGRVRPGAVLRRSSLPARPRARPRTDAAAADRASHARRIPASAGRT